MSLLFFLVDYGTIWRFPTNVLIVARDQINGLHNFYATLRLSYTLLVLDHFYYFQLGIESHSAYICVRSIKRLFGEFLCDSVYLPVAIVVCGKKIWCSIGSSTGNFCGMNAGTQDV